jgi:hypothetical protein
MSGVLFNSMSCRKFRLSLCPMSLFSQVAGNHEIEIQPDNRVFRAYNTRYPAPQNPGSFQINTSAVPANVNGSDNNLYSAAVVPGIATVVSGNIVYGAGMPLVRAVVGLPGSCAASLAQSAVDSSCVLSHSSHTHGLQLHDTLCHGMCDPDAQGWAGSRVCTLQQTLR